MAIKGYLDHLTTVGYMGYDKVYKLLLFMHIEDILYSDYIFNATEEDFEIISKALQCLYGLCLIPYSEFINSIPIMGEIKEDGLIRRIHSPILRHTEDRNYRTIESRTKLIGPQQ